MRTRPSRLYQVFSPGTCISPSVSISTSTSISTSISISMVRPQGLDNLDVHPLWLAAPRVVYCTVGTVNSAPCCAWNDAPFASLPFPRRHPHPYPHPHPHAPLPAPRRFSAVAGERIDRSVWPAGGARSPSKPRAPLFSFPDCRWFGRSTQTQPVWKWKWKCLSIPSTKTTKTTIT